MAQKVMSQNEQSIMQTKFADSSKADSGYACEIDVSDSFNLMDIMHKCPYAQVLTDETINGAIGDLQKVLRYCLSAPPVYIIKSFDAIEEHPKVSYTCENIAHQILDKIIIGKTIRDNKTKKLSLWS